jgi:hypothetical protein
MNTETMNDKMIPKTAISYPKYRKDLGNPEMRWCNITTALKLTLKELMVIVVHGSPLYFVL